MPPRALLTINTGDARTQSLFILVNLHDALAILARYSASAHVPRTTSLLQLGFIRHSDWGTFHCIVGSEEAREESDDSAHLYMVRIVYSAGSTMRSASHLMCVRERVMPLYICCFAVGDLPAPCCRI